MAGRYVHRLSLAALIGGSSVFVLSGRAQVHMDVPAASPNIHIETLPSSKRNLTFMGPGLIKETLVDDGEKVTTGQVLMRQDTDLDMKEAERLQVEAESRSRIEAAEADRKVKQLDYDRKAKAPEGYSLSEVEEAQAKLIEAEKSVKVAEEEHRQAEIKLEGEKVKLTKMELHSPIDGVVERVVSHVGEWADSQNKDGAIIVVQNDPLYVEIRGLNTRQVATLQIGEKLPLRYKNDDSSTASWQEAEIIYVQPVADAGADRQLVRLKMPNPTGRPSGLRMDLNWPQKLQDAAGKDEGILSFK